MTTENETKILVPMEFERATPGTFVFTAVGEGPISTLYIRRAGISDTVKNIEVEVLESHVDESEANPADIAVWLDAGKVTKNTYRFETDDDDAVITSIYVKRSAFTSQPERVTVLVRCT